MRLIFILLMVVLFGCDSGARYISGGDCASGDFDCGEGLECTVQLTLEGPRTGCTPIDTQTPPPPSMEPEMEDLAGMMVSEEPVGGSESGTEDKRPPQPPEWMNDFVPDEEGACAIDKQEEGTIDRQAARECFEIFQCFNEEECDQFMMLEEERTCIRACINLASLAAQIAFANFASCVRLNCITTAGELMGEECILDNCFDQADACNLIVRNKRP